MPELLLEILSEEIPARMQARAAADLERLVTGGLKEAGLGYESVQAFVTPRRLVLVVDGLPEKQPDIREERRGPRVDAPEKAKEGFFRSIETPSEFESSIRLLTPSDDPIAFETISDTNDVYKTITVSAVADPKGNMFFVETVAEGRSTPDVIREIVFNTIIDFPWSKSMVWSTNRLAWIRPIHSVLTVFDGKRLTGGIRLGSHELGTRGGYFNSNAMAPAKSDPVRQNFIYFGDKTKGHRFLAPDTISVDGFADYKTKLERAYVLLDPAERRKRIEQDLRKLAKAEKLHIKDDPGLLAEVAGLVEWPVALLGTIDLEYMALPHEVLTSSMRAHQKYFALETADGALAPRFGLVANMETPDGGAQIIAGNERVLRARLADAKFFWDQDRKRSLASRAPALREIVFHAKLGTVEEKVDRVQALATMLGNFIPGADKDRIRSAARLCKADLVTGMVGEFPDLQGKMGRYYAEHDGEHADVAQAIAEHYSPLGPNDTCPTAAVSVAVALADKIDTLVGFWAIDEKPTGSRDPFALRRAALGVIRLIVENELRIGLSTIFDAAFNLYDQHSLKPLWTGNVSAHSPNERVEEINTYAERFEIFRNEGIHPDLLGFFADRLKVHLRETGVRHDLITAVFSLGGEDDLVRLLARVKALEHFLSTDDGANLLVAYKRAANIVRIEEKKDKTSYNGGADTKTFAESEESTLYSALEDASTAAGSSLAKEKFTDAMAAMAALRKPVDAFFDRVTVNADDETLRTNRLRLLSAIGSTLQEVADFSKIEG